MILLNSSYHIHPLTIGAVPRVSPLFVFVFFYPEGTDNLLTLMVFSVYEFDFTQVFGQTQHGHDATKLLRCRSQGRCSGIHPKSMSNKCQF